MKEYYITLINQLAKEYRQSSGNIENIQAEKLSPVELINKINRYLIYFNCEHYTNIEMQKIISSL